MKDFFKYLIPNEDDIEWGLHVNVSGIAEIPKNVEYPPKGHPSGYFFTWQRGRVLDEFQLIYITKGTGVLETERGSFDLCLGSVFLLFPGVWHRYRPNPETGWEELYIGFKGEMAEKVLAKHFLSPNDPVINCELSEPILELFQKVFELVKSEKPGFQQIASGLVISLIGTLIAIKKQSAFTDKRAGRLVRKARFFIRQNTHREIDMKAFADENNVSYSYFRRVFKGYTGSSPHQYYLHLKMLRAKELILTTDKSVKEIAYELGFSSLFYFSRFFKQRTGQVPSALRKNYVKAHEF
ncbi:transcriptional regulator (plasmid) [Fulvitalea axinellae]|uniref:Transcriptional regulator n=1 Tax=Fulvitalea axinellae TaxID=1182444 RepID=A0AAU9D0B9_9BACT|nr:transcriptional regulator [Fulvitalea axinellae]